jgi:hypothetical protein
MRKSLYLGSLEQHDKLAVNQINIGKTIKNE